MCMCLKDREKESRQSRENRRMKRGEPAPRQPKMEEGEGSRLSETTSWQEGEEEEDLLLRILDASEPKPFLRTKVNARENSH